MIDHLDLTFPQLATAGVDVSNYNGMWCVSEQNFSQLLWQVQHMGLMSHVSQQQPQAYDLQQREYGTVGGGSVAVVDISGTMTKKGSSLSEMGSTIRARRGIRQAVNDESVKTIVLRVDSPGGTVSGTSDLAADVSEAAKKKHVVGYVEDLAASAAYWVVSQCSEVYANSSTAQIGSIGTYLGLYDLSKMADKEGIKPVVIKAGKFKAGGFPGMEISDEQIEEWQKSVDAIQAEFTAAVAKGRKMSVTQVQELVTGLTYIASDAMSLGLIDGIRSFDEVIEDLRPKPRKGVAMSERANYEDIVKACNGIDVKADSEFITGCLADKFTAEEATVLWSETLIERAKSAQSKCDELATENLQLKEQMAELESKLEASQKPSKGVAAVGTSVKRDAGDSPRQAWNEAIQEKVKSGMTREKAVTAVNREQPELREALVALANEK